MTNTTSTLVEAGDIRLHLTRSGTGPALVWLHGSGPGATGMSNFAANVPAFADWDNLVFDHPRFGESDRPHIPGDLIPYSGKHTLAALDALGIERFSLVGNSYGGGVAAWIAATVPERVERLILMAPGGVVPPTVQSSTDLPYGIQLITRAMTGGLSKDLVREFVTAMVWDPELVTDDLIELRYAAAVTYNPEIEGVPRMGDVSGMLGSITAPTLLIWGKSDRFLPHQWAELWLEKIPQAELHVFARCGHWVQYERKDSFNEMTRSFLQGS